MTREDVAAQMREHMREIIIEKKEALISLIQTIKLVHVSDFSVDLLKMRANYDYIPNWIYEIDNSIIQEHIEEIREEISRLDSMMSTLENV